MKNTNSFQIRPKTTPVLESLKTHKVFGDQVLAVQTAKTLGKTNPEIKLYKSLTGKFIVTTEPQDHLEEIPYTKVSVQSLRDEDEYRELYNSKQVLRNMRGH